MCMEDIRIGRSTIGYSDLLNTGSGGAVQIAPADPRRIGLFVSLIGTGPIHVQPSGVGDVPGGFALTTQTPTLFIGVEHVGNLMQQPWYVYAPDAPQQIFVVSTTLERQ